MDYRVQAQRVIIDFIDLPLALLGIVKDPINTIPAVFISYYLSKNDPRYNRDSTHSSQ